MYPSHPSNLKETFRTSTRVRFHTSVSKIRECVLYCASVEAQAQGPAASHKADLQHWTWILGFLSFARGQGYVSRLARCCARRRSLFRGYVMKQIGKESKV